MKIGVVKEGFMQPNAEVAVNDKVKAAAKKFEAMEWNVQTVPGNDMPALLEAFEKAKAQLQAFVDAVATNRSAER